MTDAAAAPEPGRSTAAVLPYGLRDARHLGLVPKAHPPPNERRRDANGLIVTGLGIGAFGAASFALLGAACPLCVIAAPALVGWGVVQRLRARRD